MAPVTQQAELEAWIDRMLDYLIDEWAAIPRVAAEWDSWDEADRLDFALEWPLREDRFRQLQRASLAGRFTAPQRRQYEELQRLIECHRASLERLLTR